MGLLLFILLGAFSIALLSDKSIYIISRLLCIIIAPLLIKDKYDRRLTIFLIKNLNKSGCIEKYNLLNKKLETEKKSIVRRNKLIKINDLCVAKKEFR